MSAENAAKKHGKATEWAKHLRPYGKRIAAKRVRRLRNHGPR